MQLTFGSDNSTKIQGYTDSDYVGNPDNRKSTSAYIFTYGTGAISWRSRLHECTTLSTTEAEYIATSEAQRKPYGCNDSQSTSRRQDESTIQCRPFIAILRTQYTSKSSLSYEDETRCVTVSSYSGACNREETRSSKDQHRGEHLQQPDKATPIPMLQRTKRTYGTTTSKLAKKSRRESIR